MAGLLRGEIRFSFLKPGGPMVAPAHPDGASPSSSAFRISDRKLAANRANAAKSTGPRTDAGKRASSLNAVAHGLTAHTALLPGEDAVELEALSREMFEAHRPAPGI